jgi:thioredoxin 1
MTPHFSFSAASVLLVVATSARAATPAFPPFIQWRSAVISGNQAALENLYSRNPPARALRGRTEIPSVSDEYRYWTSLKTQGITEIQPKILSLEEANGKAQLVLRIDAKGGGRNLAASMVQIWVQQLDGWHIAITQRSDFQAEADRTLPVPAETNPMLYPPPAEAQADLRTASERAAKEHKRVLVVFGANWCYDCHVLDKTFHSPGFAPLVNGSYVVVHVNIGDEGKDNNDLAAKYGVALDRGVPNLAVLEPSGKVLVAQAGEFQSTTKIGPSDVRSFLQKWRPASNNPSQTNPKKLGSE